MTPKPAGASYPNGRREPNGTIEPNRRNVHIRASMTSRPAFRRSRLLYPPCPDDLQRVVGQGAPLRLWLVVRLSIERDVAEDLNQRFFELAVHALQYLVGFLARHRRLVGAVLDQGCEDVGDGQNSNDVGNAFRT
jgi:hypothetical protein